MNRAFSNYFNLDPVCVCVLKALLIKIENFLFFSLLQINIFFGVFRLF